jgi:hypothetical protein
LSCGFELDAPAGSFSAVIGAWQVPSVTTFGFSIANTSAVVWVGIDGDNLTDLVQAGTGQDACYTFVFGIPWTLHSYYGWTEFLPQQPTLQVVPNFVVHPGDQVFVEVSLLGEDGKWLSDHRTQTLFFYGCLTSLDSREYVIDQCVINSWILLYTSLAYLYRSAKICASLGSPSVR